MMRVRQPTNERGVRLVARPKPSTHKLAGRSRGTAAPGHAKSSATERESNTPVFRSLSSLATQHTSTTSSSSMARLASIQDLDDKLSELDAYNHTIAIFTGVCLNRSFRQLRECQQAGGDCSAKQAAFISESTSRSSPCVNSTYVCTATRQQQQHTHTHAQIPQRGARCRYSSRERGATMLDDNDDNGRGFAVLAFSRALSLLRTHSSSRMCIAGSYSCAYAVAALAAGSLGALR